MRLKRYNSFINESVSDIETNYPDLYKMLIDFFTDGINETVIKFNDMLNGEFEPRLYLQGNNFGAGIVVNGFNSLSDILNELDGNDNLCEALNIRSNGFLFIKYKIDKKDYYPQIEQEIETIKESNPDLTVSLYPKDYKELIDRKDDFIIRIQKYK